MSDILTSEKEWLEEWSKAYDNEDCAYMDELTLVRPYAQRIELEKNVLSLAESHIRSLNKELEESKKRISELEESRTNIRKANADLVNQRNELEEVISQYQVIEYDLIMEKEANRWRACKKELPPPGDYDGYSEEHGIFSVARNGGVWFNKFGLDIDPTHWMPRQPPTDQFVDTNKMVEVKE